MKKKQKRTAGDSIIAGAKGALAFARGEKEHGCIVHIPEEIDVKAIREKVEMSQSEFSRAFGVSRDAGALGTWATCPHWAGACFSDRDRS